MKIDKEVYKYINYELMHYEEYKKLLKEEKENIITNSPLPPDGQPKGKGMPGKPTENKAIKISTSVAIMKMEKTIKAIDTAYNDFSDEYRRVFDLYYIGKYGIVKTCRDANISEKTFYRWRDNIVYSVGTELGVI